MARRNTAGESYQIGELAARGGVTPDTLRYYERLGLLPEAPRTDGGFRLYSEAALDRLRFIKQAQTLGLTLHEVGDLVRYQDSGGVRRCRQVRDLLRAKLEDLQNKLTELEAFKQTLARFLEDCERALAVTDRTSRRTEPECPVIETLRSKRS
jgi:DNA-binding transcriptional MerR regulator